MDEREKRDSLIKIFLEHKTHGFEYFKEDTRYVIVPSTHSQGGYGCHEFYQQEDNTWLPRGVGYWMPEWQACLKFAEHFENFTLEYAKEHLNKQDITCLITTHTAKEVAALYTEYKGSDDPLDKDPPWVYSEEFREKLEKDVEKLYDALNNAGITNCNYSYGISSSEANFTCLLGKKHFYATILTDYFSEKEDYAEFCMSGTAADGNIFCFCKNLEESIQKAIWHLNWLNFKD